MTPAIELVSRRREAGITQTEFADALGIERTTLWKRERNPEKAPSGFWVDYAAKLNELLVNRARQALELAAA